MGLHRHLAANCLVAGARILLALAPAAAGTVIAFVASPLLAFAQSASSKAVTGAAQSIRQAWPGKVTTRHTVTIGGKSLTFDATAGYVTLRNSGTRKAIADVAFIAFTRVGDDIATRPLTFAFNGGPGYASAWLNIGALGPWRISMAGKGVFPSARPELTVNQESWLPFTDMVFIDPAGTGYGRIHGSGATGSLWSVSGDIDALATVIRRWVEANGRTKSPKFLAGESYGGFRVPLVTHELQTDQGIGINGQILISPVLDFARRRHRSAMSYVAALPSIAATAMSAKAGAKGASHSDLASVESYARGRFLTDLVRGRSDASAVKRLNEKIVALTGLDQAFVARRAGRISTSVFAREYYRKSGRVAAIYDGLVTGLDPDRHASRNQSEDQMRLGLHAPIIQAMVGLYREKLKWVYPDGRYQFQNKRAGRNWKWGRRPPESVSELASTLALDPNMRILVVHGLTDLATPYFETRLVLDDMPMITGGNRITFKVYMGGHMFYSRAKSRQSFRDDAQKLIGMAKSN